MIKKIYNYISNSIFKIIFIILYFINNLMNTHKIDNTKTINNDSIDKYKDL